MFFKDRREASPWQEDNADDLLSVVEHTEVAGAFATKSWYSYILPRFHRWIGRHFKVSFDA